MMAGCARYLHWWGSRLRAKLGYIDILSKNVYDIILQTILSKEEYMTELTLASRPASTAGIEGITSRYDADRAAAEREERVAAFDGIVDALLREKQESNASESDLLSQSSTTESKRHLPQQAEFDSHYLNMPMRIIVRDSGDGRREITLQPILRESERETTLASSKQVYFTAPDKAVTGVQCEYFPPHKPGQKVETTGVRDASNRELESLKAMVSVAELRGSKPASR